MQKCVCSGCGYNFAALTMFEDHRAGSYGGTDIPIGKSSRLCLTPEEMKAKGWELQELSVEVRGEGVVTHQNMQTWIVPDQLEKRLAKYKKHQGHRHSVLTF